MLDVGSGAGTDSLVAAQMVGPEGSVTGIDMTPEMLAKASTAAAQMAPLAPTVGSVVSGLKITCVMAAAMPQIR